MICHSPKKLGDGHVRRNPIGYLYATTHRPSAFANHLDHGIRSDPLPKASARPRLHLRKKRSEAAKSLWTSLASRSKLVAMGGLLWREGESILRSKYDFFDGAAGFVENRKAGGDNGRRCRQ